MKRFLKTPACLAFFASWAISLTAHAQLNTNTRFAELNQADIRDVAVQTPYTPYGDKTTINRYGDDGSAAMVEASGLVLWRTSDGVYRPLPNTVYAKPLFVSNSECIIWKNAYDPSVNVDATTNAVTRDIQISYFRIDSAPGVLRESSVLVEGNKVLDTPLITTTTSPYTLVTANVAELPAATNISHPLQNLFVYRLTHTTQTPELLSANVWSSNEYLTYGVETISVGADGSQILRLSDSGIGGAMFVWVNTEGHVKSLFRATDPFVVAAVAAGYSFTADTYGGGYFTGGTYPILRPVLTSSARFVFGGARYDLNNTLATAALYNYSRDPGAGEIQVQPTITLPFPVTVPPTTTGEVIPLPNFSQQGVAPVFATQDTVGNVHMFKLSGNLATFLYKAKLPQALGMDVAVTRINANPGFESIALRDATNGGIVWLHNGLGRNLLTGSPVATTNFTLIPEVWGRPLFVTPGEVIVWTNALATVLPDGSLQPVLVKHYGRDAVTGAIATNEVQVNADATVQNFNAPGAIRGTQVFAPFPFTQATELWRLETGEKLSSNSLRVRRYQLLTPTNGDSDGDGIADGQETGPFYVIPGSFSYSQAVKDAARRGGHLATIADATEYALMQKAIQLWQINSPLALPKLTVPYPLWIGLDGIGATSPYTWQWQVETPVVSPAYIATQWAPGEPANVAGRNHGRLNSAQKWEASNPNNLCGYLLELTPTDPLAKDTDGDGANDYDELFRLITNPVVDNFTSQPGPPATLFPTTTVNGNYEGFLTDLNNGPVASFTLSVTTKGGFTGKISGASGVNTLRGTFNSTGAVTQIPVLSGKTLTATLSMWVAPDPVTLKYRVSGRLIGENGDDLVFELRRGAYSKTNPATDDKGSYTIAIPAAKFAKEGQPNGDGYLVGTIASDGLSRLRGYTSDGMALSWSGYVMEGNFLSFFSLLTKNSGYVGSNLFLRKSAEVSTYGELAGYFHLVGQADLDGDLLVVRKPVTSGTSLTPGYTFHSGAYGSAFLPVSYNQLPAFSEFVVQPNNVVLKFIDGAFSGQDVIATWSTKNQITIPKTQTRTLSATINSKTGELTGSYRYNDPVYSYAASTGSLGGVVLQKSGEVRGYYKAGTGSGQIVLNPNLDGSQAPITKIYPASQDLSPKSVTYKIYVTASEPWTVKVPVGWVNVTPLSGTGNAELVVTVSKNSTNLKRSAELTIAGLIHKINQDWDRDSPSSSVTITPSVRTVNYLGGTYSVMVTGGVGLTTEDFSSPVDWVTVVPSADFKSASVTVPYWPSWSSGYSFTPRTVDVTIGGATHRVIQTTYYSYWYYYY